MIPRKPYLLNALCDWAEDNGWTPMIVVRADVPGTVVPTAQVREGQITLNISQQATRERQIDPEGVRALARFAGEIQRLRVPLEAIEAFVVRETGEGTLFPPEPEAPAEQGADADPGPDAAPDGDTELGPRSEDGEGPDDEPPTGGSRPRRGHLKLVK